MQVNKIIKPSRFDNYALVPSDIFRQKGISAAATGLYAWLFSHRSEQDITVTFIKNHFKEGRDAINSKLKELENYGYLERKQVRSGGKFIGYNYVLWDAPQPEKPITEKPEPDNPQQSNIIYNNNNYNKSINKVEKPVKVFDPSVEVAYEHFVQLFPKTSWPKTNAQKDKWKDCLDKVHRIDGYDLKAVYLVCKKLRADDFWQDNFLSLLKLRNTDKNGVKYIDRFMAAQNKAVLRHENLPEVVRYYTYLEPSGKLVLGAKTRRSDLDPNTIIQKAGIEFYNRVLEKIIKEDKK